MPRLVDGVGVAEQRRVPVHVDDVVKTTQRVVVDLKKAILFKAAKNNL
jgi:hypothetical protein